jgi:phage gp46-like protein
MSSSAHYNVPPLPSASNPSRISPESQVVDVKLFNEADGGNIEIVNGMVTMSAGLETSVYLSLFGGNEQDSGLQADDSKQFWGNLSETDPAKQYRSRTQYALRALPAIPANLLRLEDAVKADLAWMLVSVASKVDVVASMPALNRVGLAVAVTVSDKVYELQFLQPWSRA